MSLFIPQKQIDRSLNNSGVNAESLSYSASDTIKNAIDKKATGSSNESLISTVQELIDTIAGITDASLYNPYVLNLAPSEFIITDTITFKKYVYVSGSKGTILKFQDGTGTYGSIDLSCGDTELSNVNIINEVTTEDPIFIVNHEFPKLVENGSTGSIIDNGGVYNYFYDLNAFVGVDIQQFDIILIKSNKDLCGRLLVVNQKIDDSTIEVYDDLLQTYSGLYYDIIDVPIKIVSDSTPDNESIPQFLTESNTVFDNASVGDAVVLGLGNNVIDIGKINSIEATLQQLIEFDPNLYLDTIGNNLNYSIQKVDTDHILAFNKDGIGTSSGNTLTSTSDFTGVTTNDIIYISGYGGYPITTVATNVITIGGGFSWPDNVTDVKFVIYDENCIFVGSDSYPYSGYIEINNLYEVYYTGSARGSRGLPSNNNWWMDNVTSNNDNDKLQFISVYSRKTGILVDTLIGQPKMIIHTDSDGKFVASSMYLLNPFTNKPISKNYNTGTTEFASGKALEIEYKDFTTGGTLSTDTFTASGFTGSGVSISQGDVIFFQNQIDPNSFTFRIIDSVDSDTQLTLFSEPTDLDPNYSITSGSNLKYFIMKCDGNATDAGYVSYSTNDNITPNSSTYTTFVGYALADNSLLYQKSKTVSWKNYNFLYDKSYPAFNVKLDNMLQPYSELQYSCEMGHRKNLFFFDSSIDTNITKDSIFNYLDYNYKIDNIISDKIIQTIEPYQYDILEDTGNNFYAFIECGTPYYGNNGMYGTIFRLTTNETTEDFDDVNLKDILIMPEKGFCTIIAKSTTDNKTLYAYSDVANNYQYDTDYLIYDTTQFEFDLIKLRNITYFSQTKSYFIDFIKGLLNYTSGSIVFDNIELHHLYTSNDINNGLMNFKNNKYNLVQSENDTISVIFKNGCYVEADYKNNTVGNKGIINIENSINVDCNNLTIDLYSSGWDGIYVNNGSRFTSDNLKINKLLGDIRTIDESVLRLESNINYSKDSNEIVPVRDYFKFRTTFNIKIDNSKFGTNYGSLINVKHRNIIESGTCSFSVNGSNATITASTKRVDFSSPFDVDTVLAADYIRFPGAALNTGYYQIDFVDPSGNYVTVDATVLDESNVDYLIFQGTYISIYGTFDNYQNVAQGDIAIINDIAYRVYEIVNNKRIRVYASFIPDNTDILNFSILAGNSSNLNVSLNRNEFNLQSAAISYNPLLTLDYYEYGFTPFTMFNIFNAFNCLNAHVINNNWTILNATQLKIDIISAMDVYISLLGVNTGNVNNVAKTDTTVKTF